MPEFFIQTADPIAEELVIIFINVQLLQSHNACFADSFLEKDGYFMP